MLPMWLADMDFATAPPIIDALRERVDHGVYGYTTYTDEFFDAIAIWAEARHGWRPFRDWIVPSSGVMPSISVLIQTLTDVGDGVIVQPPVFHPIPEAAELNSRRVLRNPLRMESGRYEMDLADLESKATNARMMVLCHPHNPVGRVWSPAELRAVAEICSKHEVILVSDEIHGDLTYPWAEFVSAGSIGDEFHEGLVVCTGPSKAFNLPGLKLSLTIIPDEELRSAYLTTLNSQNELWGANLFGAVALEAAYTTGAPWLAQLMEVLAANAAHVAEFLDSRLPELELIRPDALYLLWIDCRRTGLTSAQLDAAMRAAGLWVEQGATYGDEGNGFIRMTIACSRSVLDAGLRRLEIAFKGA